MARSYVKKARAHREEETRLRIVEAAVELHRTVGPAGTSFAAVASMAGLPRQTVYRHFGNDTALFAACSTHFLLQHPPPDPSAWLSEPDLAVRLELALSEVYSYYRANAPMLGNVLRDAGTMPSLRQFVDPYRAFQMVAREVIAGAWRAASETLRAAIGLALDFDTWRLLVVDQGLSDGQAIDLMVLLAKDASIGQSRNWIST